MLGDWKTRADASQKSLGRSGMFIPPYRMILDHLGVKPSNGSGAKTLMVSKDVFDLMIMTILRCIDFDEEQYLSLNPDVRQAVQEGLFLNGRDHFARYGYFEGRMGGVPVIDPEWYALANADVADALKVGEVDSAQQHYFKWGIEEWRAPNREALELVEAWRCCLKAWEGCRNNGDAKPASRRLKRRSRHEWERA
jgi:hypothetical protein